jgi:putative flippase GtrA
MRQLLKYQFVRFLVVGGINTSVAYAAYAALLYTGLSYPAASFGALLLGIMFSFRTQGALVFRNRDSRLLLRYACTWGAIYLLNTWLIGRLIELSIDVYIAGALAIFPLTIFSYIAQKFLVFNERRSPPSEDT